MGKQRIVDTIIEMIDSAKEDVVLTTRYWGSKWGNKRIQNEFGIEKFRKSIKNAVERGVKIRIVGNIDENTIKNAIEIKTAGASVRHIQYGYLRFIIQDNSKLLIAVSEPYTETLHFYYAIITNHKELVLFFKDYFNNLWNEAKDLEETA